MHGLTTGDAETLRAALDEDVLHVPFRRALVPGLRAGVRCQRARQGAFGATLSGSGSTVVAVAPERQAQAVAEAMCAVWRARGVQAEGMVEPVAGGWDEVVVVHNDCRRRAGNRRGSGLT